MENLSTKFVRRQGKKTAIDIAKILQFTESEVILIQFEKQVSMDELNPLVPFPHISNTPLYRFLYPSENLIVAPIEVTVDYPNLWYKQFDSVKIKEIHREYNLIISPNNINELLSVGLKERLNELNKQMRLKPKDILTIGTVSKIFKKFETDSSLVSQLSQAVSTDKPSNVEFISFSGKTKDVDIHGTKLALPDFLNIKLKINFDAKEFTLSAKFIIDYNIIVTVIAGLSKEADMSFSR